MDVDLAALAGKRMLRIFRNPVPSFIGSRRDPCRNLLDRAVPILPVVVHLAEICRARASQPVASLDHAGTVSHVVPLPWE